MTRTNQAEPGDFLPLTNSQQLIWIGQQLYPNRPMNNMAFLFRWQRKIDVARMQSAFQELVARTDCMRLQLTQRQDQWGQRILPTLEYHLPFEDWSDLPSPDQRLKNWCDAAINRVFDPTKQLFSAGLFKLGTEDFALFLNQHHLITDGWGLAIQYERLLNAYQGSTESKPSLPPTFAAYVTENYTQSDSGPVVTKTADYWATQIEAAPGLPSFLGHDNPDNTSISDRHLLQLSTEQMAAIRALCERPEFRAWSADLAQYQFFGALLFALLYRISNQANLTVGTPAHNRTNDTYRQTAGVFMELFSLGLSIAPADSFADLYLKVQAAAMDFLRHATPGSSTPALNRSFNVLYNYLNVQLQDPEDWPVEATWWHSGHSEPGHVCKFQVFDFDRSGTVTLSLDLNREVFPVDFQPQVLSLLEDLLENFLNDPSQPFHQPGLRELDQLQSTFPELKPYPGDLSVIDLFRRSVAQYPDQIAVAVGTASLTFRELETRSNQVAHALLAEGVKSEDRVAICLDRSLDMMVGLLAILKAGGAYVPIDPEYPADRRDFMISDAQAALVLTTQNYRSFFTGRFAEKVMLIDGNKDQFAAFPPSVPSIQLRPDQLMYVLYTSGSTGRPKGVMNQHDGVVNRLLWAQDTFQLVPGQDVVLQKTTFCFDVSVWELFWPLLVGVKLVFARPGGRKDGDYLEALIKQEEITTIHFVPSMLEAFLLSDRSDATSLRRVLCSGEALQVHQVNAFQDQFPEVELHNLYGPTEAAIDVTHWPVPAETPKLASIPIGKPVANTPLVILNASGHLVPVGVPGELYIGGIQVARGYHQRPDLTADRFQLLQLPQVGNGRYYRTGDYVRWLPDGNIEFLGRRDNQVKLRGFRVELGEIEATLRSISSIQQAVVLLRMIGTGEGQLVAFLVTDSGEDLSTANLKVQLESQLPDYMVPTHFTVVSALPLTPNGKLDRKKLLALTPAAVETSTAPPAGPFEEMIAEIWQEVLGLKFIGREARFIDLGGHSLNAIRIMGRLNQTLGITLPVNLVFRHPTIAQLASFVEAELRQRLAEMEQKG